MTTELAGPQRAYRFGVTRNALCHAGRVSDEKLDALAQRLKRAARVTILTGAGVSAASGVPTFRGNGGLWRQFRSEDLA